MWRAALPLILASSSASASSGDWRGAPSAWEEAGPGAAPAQQVVSATRPEVRTSQRSPFGMRVLLYVPNRLLDVFDVARLRARVGPGVAVSVRLTDAADLYVGAYASLYAGLPGPRNRPLPKLPLGAETRAGVEVSTVDLAPSLWLTSPDYGPYEVGVGVHLLVLGVDVGVDPLELVDLLGGFLFLDPARDDL
ncbi:MAG: hypothetical protein JXX28_08215 [Deltaproteobacteria bacterium]|nr:hypothetical protein [Deltaproteobacteria bacterium]